MRVLGLRVETFSLTETARIRWHTSASVAWCGVWGPGFQDYTSRRERERRDREREMRKERGDRREERGERSEERGERGERGEREARA